MLSIYHSQMKEGFIDARIRNLDVDVFIRANTLGDLSLYYPEDIYGMPLFANGVQQLIVIDVPQMGSQMSLYIKPYVEGNGYYTLEIIEGKVGENGTIRSI